MFGFDFRQEQVFRDVPVLEKPFTVAELRRALEVMLSA
jgi:hypothetical protein